jgi:hypothetical protein
MATLCLTVVSAPPVNSVLAVTVVGGRSTLTYCPPGHGTSGAIFRPQVLYQRPRTHESAFIRIHDIKRRQSYH